MKKSGNGSNTEYLVSQRTTCNYHDPNEVVVANRSPFGVISLVVDARAEVIDAVGRFSVKGSSTPFRSDGKHTLSR